MEFTFDVKQTPLIGKNMHTRSETDKSDEIARYVQHDVVALQSSANQASNSPKRSSSLSPADNAAIGWKRPWMSQVPTYIVVTTDFSKLNCAFC